MTVSLCIRQGSKRNDDSVSVEELDWSAESQVLIPAEHLCVTLNADLEPKINLQTPMTNSSLLSYESNKTLMWDLEFHSDAVYRMTVSVKGVIGSADNNDACEFMHKLCVWGGTLSAQGRV